MVVCVGLTVGLDAVGFVKDASSGLAVQVYPEELPLTFKVTAAPEHMVLPALTVKSVGAVRTILV